MGIRACVVFSLSVFFVVVRTIFICAVFLWAPERLCDLGLDLNGDELNERETSTTVGSILYQATFTLATCSLATPHAFNFPPSF